MAPQQYTDDGFEIHFAINHLGHFLLTNIVLDLLKVNLKVLCFATKVSDMS